LIFIDTGAFIARHVVKDQYHFEALPTWDRILRDGIRCFTSNLVMEETITLIARETGYPFAHRVARLLYSTPGLEILRSSDDLDLTALDLFIKYADQEVSFTDCVSFALMKAHRLTRVFCFDRHFDAPGFTRIPLVPLV
jgi:predicted nucleic acid-binding protein